MRYRNVLLLGLFVGLSFAACKKTDMADDAPQDPEKSYFSIRQFAADQYQLLKGQPFTFTKITTVNGKTDSMLVPYDEIDWGTIFKLFCDADISNNKYFERYDVNSFDDNTLETSVMAYTAREKDLFVQKFNLNYDNMSGRINMIYIETADNGRFHSKEQKLSYYVQDRIVIQETEKSFMSDPKEVMITYKFP